jgi:predicted alpha/beta superfamily hydrolase
MITTYLKIYFSTFLFCLASAVLAQSTTAPTINQKQEHVVKSKINNNTYHLSVSLPMHYAAKDTTRYPVLYLLDGGLNFPIAHAARMAMDMTGELEQFIIVGIEYEWEKSLQPWMILRWKDFTHSKVIGADTNKAFLRLVDLKKGDLLSGGANNFINVLQKEIIPFIENQYNTNNDRGISGHSLGGLFASYCLFTQQNLFQRYGINSPSLWWNKREMFFIEKEFSEKNTALPARVFMSVGSLEGASMTPLMVAFADSLLTRNYTGLNLSSHVFESETHMSVLPAMISRTIKVLYGKNK